VRKLHLYYNNQYQFQLFFIRRLCLLWIDAKIRMILIQKHAVKVPALKMCFYFPQTLKSRHISKNSKCTEASLYEVHTIIQGKKKKHMRCKSWYRLRVIPSQVLAACLVLYLAWMGECKKRLTWGAANKVPPCSVHYARFHVAWFKHVRMGAADQSSNTNSLSCSSGP